MVLVGVLVLALEMFAYKHFVEKLEKHVVEIMIYTEKHIHTNIDETTEH